MEGHGRRLMCRQGWWKGSWKRVDVRAKGRLCNGFWKGVDVRAGKGVMGARREVDVQAKGEGEGS